jgi:uncharacterized protein
MHDESTIGLFSPDELQGVPTARRGRADFVTENVATFLAGGRATSREARWPRLMSATVAVAARPSILSSVPLAAMCGALLMVYCKVLQSVGAPEFNGGVLAAIFLASTLSSIAGFAFSAICGAMLFHLMSGPVQVVELMVVCSIAIQSLSVWALRRSIDWKVLPAFLIGGVISLPGGVYLLLHIPPKTFGAIMGMFLIAYGGFMLFRPPVRQPWNVGRIGDGIAGLLGGITGGLAGFPGALVTIWCSLKGWDKKRQRGVYQPFILVMQVLTLAAIHLMGHRGGEDVGVDLIAFANVPGALLGTWCGLNLFESLTDRQFSTSINLLLIASGAGLFAA